jgi:O-methyltransferase involved in polyketide biosynthesis
LAEWLWRAGGSSAGGGRCHLLACPVFESAWIDTVRAGGPHPSLFVAEGVLPYFGEAQVKSLNLMLRERFPGAELVCGAMAPFVVRVHNLELALSKLSMPPSWHQTGARRVYPGVDRGVEKWAGHCPAHLFH